MEKKRAI